MIVVALAAWAATSLLIGGAVVLALGPRRLPAVILPAGTAFLAGGVTAGVSVERTVAVAIAAAGVAALVQRSWSSAHRPPARGELPTWDGADADRTQAAWPRALADRRRARRRGDR